MKLENIEIIDELIEKKSILEKVIRHSEQWKNGHFEFVEHYGNAPDRIEIFSFRFPELEKKMLECIKLEIASICKELEKL